MNTLVSQGTDLRSEEEIASLLRERAMKCGLIPRPEVQNKEELVKLKKRADEFVTLVREGGTISPAKLRAFCRDVEFRLCWIAKSELYGINTAAQKAVLDGVALEP